MRINSRMKKLQSSKKQLKFYKTLKYKRQKQKPDLRMSPQTTMNTRHNSGDLVRSARSITPILSEERDSLIKESSTDLDIDENLLKRFDSDRVKFINADEEIKKSKEKIKKYRRYLGSIAEDTAPDVWTLDQKSDTRNLNYLNKIS